MSIEIIIDENGDILFNRDDARVSSIIENITSEEEFLNALKFLKEKPLNADGEQDYPSFCG